MTTGAQISFNLLDEPWIAVLGKDGYEHELSIVELFERAPDLTTIGGEVSTQAFAITWPPKSDGMSSSRFARRLKPHRPDTRHE